MYEATEPIPTAAELVAAVQRIVDQRDELLAERDELLRLLEELPGTDDELMIQTVKLPSGRHWAFVEDAMVLAISPDLDEATRNKLIAQVAPPKLTTCVTCGAPYYEGASCRMHDV